MRRGLLTFLFCGGASLALLVSGWDGGTPVLTLLLCVTCIVPPSALATYSSPRPAALHWSDKDIASYALADGFQRGIAIGLALGTDAYLRTGRIAQSLLLASGVTLVVAILSNGLRDGRGLTKQRDDARTKAPKVFD